MSVSVFVAVHTIAHLFNLERYNNSRQGVDDELSTALSDLDDSKNTTYLNPVRIAKLVSPPQIAVTLTRNQTSRFLKRFRSFGIM